VTSARRAQRAEQALGPPGQQAGHAQLAPPTAYAVIVAWAAVLIVVAGAALARRDA
jgi:hypothetical protein